MFVPCSIAAVDRAAKTRGSQGRDFLLGSSGCAIRAWSVRTTDDLPSSSFAPSQLLHLEYLTTVEKDSDKLDEFINLLIEHWKLVVVLRLVTAPEDPSF